MKIWMHRILESKRAASRETAALPFARKLALLEKVHAGSLLIAVSPLCQHRLFTVLFLLKAAFLTAPCLEGA